MTHILYDTRRVGGIRRFAGELRKVLPGLTPFYARRRPSHPFNPVLMGAALWQKKPRLFFSPGYNSRIGWPGRFVFTRHDLHRCYVQASALKSAYYRCVIQRGCHKAAFVLTVLEYSRPEIAAWANVKEEKGINVGNAVGLPFTPLGRKHDPGYPYLLYVSSRRPNKNLPRLSSAYAISGVYKDVRLVLFGYPGEYLSGLIRSFNLNGSVVFAGLCADAELSALYRGALALVYPSLCEGFGLPPLEAMACGVPVLTSNICSLSEVVGDAGVQIHPLDVDEIAEGIRRLVQDSLLRKRLQESGLQRAPHSLGVKPPGNLPRFSKLATDPG
jgi:glycosyltransferase involved in cell wall biosynthesis